MALFPPCRKSPERGVFRPLSGFPLCRNIFWASLAPSRWRLEPQESSLNAITNSHSTATLLSIVGSHPNSLSFGYRRLLSSQWLTRPTKLLASLEPWVALRTLLRAQGGASSTHTSALGAAPAPMETFSVAEASNLVGPQTQTTDHRHTSAGRENRRCAPHSRRSSANKACLPTYLHSITFALVVWEFKLSHINTCTSLSPVRS